MSTTPTATDSPTLEVLPTTAPDLRHLDLTHLVACRERAEQLEARLRRADVSALADARALDDHVSSTARAFVATVERVSGYPLSFYALQVGDVGALCDALAGSTNILAMAELLDELSTYGLGDKNGRGLGLDA